MDMTSWAAHAGLFSNPGHNPVLQPVGRWYEIEVKEMVGGGRPEFVMATIKAARPTGRPA